MNKNTILFNSENMEAELIADIVRRVYLALEEKGYDPIAQLSGYILSGFCLACGYFRRCFPLDISGLGWSGQYQFKKGVFQMVV